MQISTKSWHWRLAHWLPAGDDIHNCRNLCAYFWFLMFSFFIKIPLIVTFLLCGLVLAPVWAPMVAMGIGCYTVYQKHQERKELQQYNRKMTDQPPPPPGFLAIAWAWVKAKKQKVCPLIEFVD